MARLEDVLPALREGKRIRNKSCSKEDYFVLKNETLCDHSGDRRAIILAESLLSEDWEIVHEPTRVADYLQPDPFSMSVSGKCSRWTSKTYPIGQQPEGSVMVPGSEREVGE